MSDNRLVTVILKAGKEQSLYRRHPWIFSGAIAKIEGAPQEGQVVRVLDSQKQFLGVGHYQIGSIAIRVLSFVDEAIDQDFWIKQIKAAYDFRVAIGLAQSQITTAYRLIHGEGDGLPGLIIDFYQGTAVMQAHSVGMYLVRNEIVAALQTVLGDNLKAVYEKSSATVPFKANLNAQDGYIWGESIPQPVLENDLRFTVDWLTGQKTGFFIDQRDNRKLVEYYSKNRKVLNMFCYTGGFSVYAMNGGAQLVHSVDSSAKAIALTDANVELNFPDDKRHTAIEADAFKYLDTHQKSYDFIILDPPAFAKHNDALKNALQGYKRLNQKAIEQIEPGGILFTFSCSQVVSKEDFRKAVFAAAANTKRNVRILHQMTQPTDHPVNIYHPESEYLKGLVVYIE